MHFAFQQCKMSAVFSSVYIIVNERIEGEY